MTSQTISATQALKDFNVDFQDVPLPEDFFGIIPIVDPQYNPPNLEEKDSPFVRRWKEVKEVGDTVTLVNFMTSLLEQTGFVSAPGSELVVIQDPGKYRKEYRHIWGSTTIEAVPDMIVTRGGGKPYSLPVQFMVSVSQNCFKSQNLKWKCF